MRIAAILFVTLLFISCSTTKKEVAEVTPLKAQRTVASELIEPVSPEDAAINPDVYPYRVSMVPNQEMKILNNGSAALWARIDMARRAQKSIEVEYFIFNADMTGRILTKELVKAAERGVKVRIMVDKSIAVFVLNEFYAHILKQKNVEVRYYNTASTLMLSTVQFRNHRKLMVMDGVEAITGGRNIADEYFNLSEKFNFLDRDIWVKGDIVKAMKDSFDLYWNSDIVKHPKKVKEPRFTQTSGDSYWEQEEHYKEALKKYQDALKKAEDLIMHNPQDEVALTYLESYGAKVLNETPAYNCPEASFATDREGGSFIKRIQFKRYHDTYRLLRKEISEWIGFVDKEVILDSPYFLNNRNSLSIIDYLFKKNKKITIFTNSLASTDAIYVSAVFNEEVKKFTPNELFNAYIYKGTSSGEDEYMNEAIKNARWGTHSKTIVFSDDAFMVGTFNIDNRSNYYNTEMGLFCKGSKELTKMVRDNIETRLKNAKKLGKDGKPEDGSPLLEGNSGGRKFLYHFLQIPSALLQFLL